MTTHLAFIFNKDIDECKEETYECDINSVCINTEGSHVCQCPEGYNTVGITCIGKQMAILREWRVRLGRCCVYLHYRAVLGTLALLSLDIPKLLTTRHWVKIRPT